MTGVPPQCFTNWACVGLKTRTFWSLICSGSAAVVPLEMKIWFPTDCHHRTRTPTVSRIVLSISLRMPLSGLAVARTKASKLNRKGCSMMSMAGIRLANWLSPATPISMAPDATASTVWSSM